MSKNPEMLKTDPDYKALTNSERIKRLQKQNFMGAEEFYRRTILLVQDTINSDESLKEMQKRAQDLVKRVERLNGEMQARAEAVASKVWTEELTKWQSV